ncbi:SDR family oxidoreductase [Halorubrum sp. BOL3-1]|uniref:SDR family oxidoreductase n=1 Tax=Halorubrum sp. BOL3-1 TaxID=2497325 RepID=UPI001004DB79|nr:SDR family oxidoreductase [Halorubrum sp. BOL3-1]QAU14019.1 SDR family oxidoreductase [Halorubrum sp. BOL3-1]
MTDIEPDTILVAGASGGTGREILRLAAPRHVRIRALTRSSETAPTLRSAGADEVVVDDLLDPGDLNTAVSGVDAVISTVGTAPTAIRRGPPYVDGAGNCALVDAADAAGVETFVMESAIGVGPEPASRLAGAFDAFIGPLQEAKATAESAIRSASLTHTILRPGVLTDGRRTDLTTVARPGSKLWGTVSRSDVARLLLSAPTTSEAENETFELVSTPRFPKRDARIPWTMPR